MDVRDKPIGIFDSGIGGLTVLKEIRTLLPQERLIYLGDTARVPYGSRGRERITSFALQLTRHILQQNVKLLVVACNTISAACLSEIHRLSPVPVIDVIAPAIEEIVRQTKTKEVGIIGTRATIQSGAYQKAIRHYDPTIRVSAKACPLFVPVVEEGMAQTRISSLIATEYLQGFFTSHMDVLHLGCTHYPLLREVIQSIAGGKVQIIDSARPTAYTVDNILRKEHLYCTLSDEIAPLLYLTDAADRTQELIDIFLGAHTDYRVETVILAD